MQYFLEQVLNGLSAGSIYALIALGFSMVYGVLGLINFAHSEVFTTGVFCSYFVCSWLDARFPSHTGFTIAVALLAAMAAGAVLAFLIQVCVYEPIQNSPRILALIS